MTAKNINECGPLQLVAKDVDSLRDQHHETRQMIEKLFTKLDQIWAMALATLTSILTALLVFMLNYLLKK